MENLIKEGSDVYKKTKLNLDAEIQLINDKITEQKNIKNSLLEQINYADDTISQLESKKTELIFFK